MKSNSLGISRRNPKSLVVKWEHMKRQPADTDLYQYYRYYVEYREEGSSSDWITIIVSYNPNDDPPQATIDELTSNTEYEVRIRGVRTKGDQTDEENADKTNTETFTTLYGV